MQYIVAIQHCPTKKRKRTAPEDESNTDNDDEDMELELDDAETELYQLSDKMPKSKIQSSLYYCVDECSLIRPICDSFGLMPQAHW